METTEISKRKSIAEIVKWRNKSIKRYTGALRMLLGANRAAQIAGGEYCGLSCEIGKVRIWKGEEDEFRIQEEIEIIRKEIDRAVWLHLKNESGLVDLMDRKASEDFDRQLEETVPEVTEANIRATFSALSEQKEIIFNRGVVNVFRELDREYRNNDAFRIGKKVVLPGWFSFYNRTEDKIRDLDRIFHILDGKEPKGHREDAASVLRAAVGHLQSRGQCGQKQETPYMDFVVYKNGNVHVSFKRVDLVAKVNRIIARECGGSDRVAQRRAKKAAGL